VHTPIQTIQIDDGYCASPGDWLVPNALWPGGLQDAFERIRQAGFHAGVWVAPFAVGSRSQLFAEHPEWILRDKSGAAIAEWQNYDASGIPSHIDEETYVLDTTNPAAFEYLREGFSHFARLGRDVLQNGLHGLGLARCDTIRTSYELGNERATLPASTRNDTAGDRRRLVLAGLHRALCAVLGFADGVRVSNDSSHHWSRGSTLNMLEQMTNSQFFNNVWWQNDPDAIFLRDKYLHLSPSEIESIALFAGISGGSVNTSDALHEVLESRLQLWRFVQPDFAAQGENRNARFLHWNDKSHKLLVAVREYSNGDCGMLALNLRDESVTEMVSVKEATSFAAPFAFCWTQNGNDLLGHKDELIIELAPHESRLFYISQNDKAPAANFTVGGATYPAIQKQYTGTS
jgi:hypothetical protein